MIRMAIGVDFSFRLAGALLIIGGLAACDSGLLQSKADEPGVTVAAKAGKKDGQSDRESPETFEVSEAGLWDGRPSLGGIWVAHPDVTDPHRVLIRNTANDTSVVGALFRRERDIPGPRIQASSEAAEALSMLPGAPVQLHVVALVRDPVAQEVDEGNTGTVTADEDPTGTGTAAAEMSEDAPPPEKKFRWPWSKPKDDAVVDGVGEALESPAEISETALDPIESSAAMQQSTDPTGNAAIHKVALGQPTSGSEYLSAQTSYI